MLLFIGSGIYPRLFDIRISIHLMLLFIGRSLQRRYRCYISIHLMLLFILLPLRLLQMLLHFNTSHVTVYRHQDEYDTEYDMISIHLMLLFIQERISYSIIDRHFNTSHVTVYQRKLCFSNIGVTDFNTSHVTVYHVLRHLTDLVCSISIHLMLLFIDSNPKTHLIVVLFQYISCYCLSIHFISYCTYSFYFNTSHVTVYPIYTPNIFLASSISIHLMLLFIPALQGRHLLSLQFQYISCYCLSERRRL